MGEARLTQPEPLFLTQGGQRMFASLHRGIGDAKESLGVVVCPALADEHIACYRIVYRFAEFLAAAGVSVLRIDPPGHGDSEGLLADATPERVARVAAVGARFLRERTGVEQVGFLGIRLGCLGALEAAQNTPGDFCVGWAPVLSAERYFRDLLRRQVLSDVMYGGGRRSVDALLAELSEPAGAGIDIGGYLLTASLYDAYCGVDVPDRLASASVPLLVVQQEKPSAGSPRALLEAVAKSLSGHHASEVEVFWNFPREGSVPPSPREWFEVTRSWLLQRARAAAGEG